MDDDRWRSLFDLTGGVDVGWLVEYYLGCAVADIQGHCLAGRKCLEVGRQIRSLRVRNRWPNDVSRLDDLRNKLSVIELDIADARVSGREWIIADVAGGRQELRILLRQIVVRLLPACVIVRICHG